jgi:threonine aldolase
MTEQLVDLRSDTVTRPSAAMRDAMARAAVGDDVYAEDPTVNELEALAAEQTGKEAALFVPSGCMANLIAQMIHVRRGDEVVIGEHSHCFLFETGAGPAVAGVQYNVVPGDGRFTAEQVEERFRLADFHTPGTGLVWIENTHNMGGGTVFPLEEIRRLRALCDRLGLPLHMDGARVYNAAIATGVAVAEIAAPVDALSFCLSKGLGAPIGSLLCGSGDFRRRAHRLRKMLGGGMRQVGIVAAAGIHALRHNVERLADDHARARRLAEGLGRIDGLEVDPAAVDTNIVMVRVTACAADNLVRRCRERGLLFSSLSRESVRFVTHLDVDDGQIDRAVEIVAASL